MKKALALILALVMVFALCACGTAETPAPAETPAETGTDTPAETETETPYIAKGEGDFGGATLVVANWQGYCFDAPYVMQEFEKRFNCKIEMVNYDSYDDLMTRLQTGDSAVIDVCNVSQNYTQYFRDNDLIMIVDKEQIPNFAGLADAYREVYPYNVDEEGNVFAFPWCFGATSLVYNPEAIDFTPEHWTDLLNEQLTGKVATNRDYGDGMILAALLSGQDPAFPDEVDLAKVNEALAEFKPQILTFWGSYDEIMKPWKSGEFVAGTMWSGAYVQLKAEGYPIEYVHPTEGTIGYIDNACIVKGTDQYELAIEYINFLESYEIQYTMATTEGSDYNPEDWGYMSYPPVNAKALEELTEEQRATLYLNPEPTKLCMLNYLSPEMKDAWVDCWNNFMAE